MMTENQVDVAMFMYLMFVVIICHLLCCYYNSGAKTQMDVCCHTVLTTKIRIYCSFRHSTNCKQWFCTLVQQQHLVITKLLYYVTVHGCDAVTRVSM